MPLGVVLSSKVQRSLPLGLYECRQIEDRLVRVIVTSHVLLGSLMA